MNKNEIKTLIELLDKMLNYCELPDDRKFWDIEDGVANIRRYLKELENESAK